MSLADKIASVLSAAPSSFDPDNDSVDNTTAQVTVPEIVEEDPQEAEILSKFRKDNINLLADVDERYAGKKASRRSLVDEDEDSDDSLEDESGASETENNVSQDDAPLSYSEDESEDDNDIEEESGSEDDYEDASLLSNDPTEAEFTHIKEDDVSNQVKKAICVKNQMAMWENLLEVRIQLQKCLFTANKMPQISTFNEIKQSCPEFSNKVSETRNILTGTLDKLLLLQETLVKQYPETKKVFKDNNNTKEISDDEEIPSDTESEHSKDDESSTPVETNPKKRKTGDYESDIQQHHKKYRDYRNSVIQKWNDKTRIVVKKDGSSSHSLLNQIEFNLSNKEKLVKRTQLKRSQYEILGVEPNDSEVGEEYNTEIYDDDDFYHQLLRELIEVKSADITDPIQLGRQWIQLQNMRSKMKRKIDTRATKGRKIRYAVHSKLVNFMAPIDEQQWTDEAKNELYNSLFGKKQPNIQ